MACLPAATAVHSIYGIYGAAEVLPVSTGP